MIVSASILTVISINSFILCHGAIIADKDDVRRTDSSLVASTSFQSSSLIGRAPCPTPSPTPAPTPTPTPALTEDSGPLPSEADVQNGAIKMLPGVDIKNKDPGEIAEMVAAVDAEKSAIEDKARCMAGCAKRKALEEAAKATQDLEDKESAEHVRLEVFAKDFRAQNVQKLQMQQNEIENRSAQRARNGVILGRKRAEDATAIRDQQTEQVQAAIKIQMDLAQAATEKLEIEAEQAKKEIAHREQQKLDEDVKKQTEKLNDIAAEAAHSEVEDIKMVTAAKVEIEGKGGKGREATPSPTPSPTPASTPTTTAATPSGAPSSTVSGSTRTTTATPAAAATSTSPSSFNFTPSKVVLSTSTTTATPAAAAAATSTLVVLGSSTTPSSDSTSTSSVPSTT